MKTKWTIESVRKYINDNSECELISTEYKTVDDKLNFKCNCGNLFTTTFYKFKSRNKRQCNTCGFINGQNKSKLSYEEVKKFIELDSNSGCKLKSETYKNAHDKLELECQCGNEFHVKWAHFKNSNKRQCNDCGSKLIGDSKRMPFEKVCEIIESKNCKLLSEYINIDEKIKIECECGKPFFTSLGLFRDFDVNRCRDCRKLDSRSKGESKIENWLIENGLEFEPEYTYENLKSINKLRFDFAIFNKNGDVKLLIEYDGKQHFGLGNFSNDTNQMIENYQKTIQNDNAKNEFCYRNGIPLLRIPYNKYDKIINILNIALN